MKKRQGITELRKTIGGTIKEKRFHLEENAKVEREAAKLNTPFVLTTKQPKPRCAYPRE